MLFHQLAENSFIMTLPLHPFYSHHYMVIMIFHKREQQGIFGPLTNAQAVTWEALCRISTFSIRSVKAAVGQTAPSLPGNSNSSRSLYHVIRSVAMTMLTWNNTANTEPAVLCTANGKTKLAEASERANTFNTLSRKSTTWLKINKADKRVSPSCHINTAASKHLRDAVIPVKLSVSGFLGRGWAWVCGLCFAHSWWKWWVYVVCNISMHLLFDAHCFVTSNARVSTYTVNVGNKHADGFMCLWDHTYPTCWIRSLILISQRHSSNYHECAEVSMEIFPCRHPNRADGLKLSTMRSFPDHERCLQTTAWSGLIVLPVWCLRSFWFKTLTVVKVTPLSAAYLCHSNASYYLVLFLSWETSLN